MARAALDRRGHGPYRQAFALLRLVLAWGRGPAHRRTRQALPGSQPDPRAPVFTDRQGQAVRPERLTGAFRDAVIATGLPPVRLHDLRHGAASLALAAGVDLKTVQDLLGHSTIITTADIYTSVLPPVHERCADAVADLLDAAARRRPHPQH